MYSISEIWLILLDDISPLEIGLLGLWIIILIALNIAMLPITLPFALIRFLYKKFKRGEDDE